MLAKFSMVPTRHNLQVGLTMLVLQIAGALVPNALAQGPAGGPASRHESRYHWQSVPGTPPSVAPNGAAPSVRPRRFNAQRLDRPGLSSRMAAAPREFTPAADQAPLVVSLPTPDGGFERFAMVESPIMEPSLAAKHGEIKTYAGRGIDNPAATIRADVTPLGFHASVRSPGGAWYIDPYYNGDDGLYVSYHGRDLENPHGILPESGSLPPGINVDRGYYLAAESVRLTGIGFPANISLEITITAQGGLSRVIAAMTSRTVASTLRSAPIHWAISAHTRFTRRTVQIRQTLLTTWSPRVRRWIPL